MALDTRNKRASLINLGWPIGRLLPEADGLIDGADRGQLAYLYAEQHDTPAPPSPPPPPSAGRASISGFSAASVAGSTTLTDAHTAVAGQGVWLIVFGTTNNSNDPVGAETATWEGISMNLCARGGAAAGGFIAWWVFSLPAALVTAGAGTLQFNAADNNNYSCIAFNQADGASDARPVLFGSFYRDQWAGAPRIFTKKAYGWDSLGLEVAALYGENGATVVLSGGTTVASGSGMQLNTADCADTEIAFTASRASGDRLALIAFMIPPGEVTQPRTSGGRQVVFGGFTDMTGLFPTESTIAGLPFGGAGSRVGNIGNLILTPGSFDSWAIETPVPVGAGNVVTAELMLGGTSGTSSTIGFNNAVPTGITLTLSGAVQTTNARAVDLSWAKYQRLSVQLTYTSGTTLPAGVRIASTFLAQTGEIAALMHGGGGKQFGSSFVNTAFRRAPLHPDTDVIWSNFPASEKSLNGIPCSVREMVVDYQTDVSLTPDHQYYMEKYPAATPLLPALQDGSGGSVNTVATLVADSLGPALARSRFVLPYAPYDLMACVGFVRDAASAFLRQSVSLKIVADVPGKQMVAGHSVAGTGTGNYVAFPVSPRTDTTTTLAQETRYASRLPSMVAAAGGAFRVLGFKRYLEPTGPGAGSETTTLRKNLADAGMTPLVLTGSAGAPLTGETGGDVAFVGNDQLGFLNVEATNPVLARQFWALEGFITPPSGTGTPDDLSPGPGSGIGVACPNDVVQGF